MPVIAYLFTPFGWLPPSLAITVFTLIGLALTVAEVVHQTALPATKPGAMVYTDEWGAYKSLPRYGRGHASVFDGSEHTAAKSLGFCLCVRPLSLI